MTTGRRMQQERRSGRRRRLMVSGAMALALVGSVAGAASAHGPRFLGSTRSVTRTTAARDAVTVTRVHCMLWFWCSPASAPVPEPTTSSGMPVTTTTAPEAATTPMPSTSAAAPVETTLSAPVTTDAPAGTDAPAANTTAPPATAPTTSSPTAPPATATPTSDPAEDAVSGQILDQLNAARAAAGVAPLSMSDGLVRSATKHSLLMAGGCGMSHQCPGEADLGTRISAESVTWTSVGENVGYGGPMPRTDDGIVAMGKRLTEAMLAETPPNDGHRRNILNAGFTRVGISLYQDAQGTVWMTQDFAS